MGSFQGEFEKLISIGEKQEQVLTFIHKDRKIHQLQNRKSWNSGWLADKTLRSCRQFFTIDLFE